VSERGLSALTLDAVAEESGVYRSAIRYHFGDKAGLVSAVMDSTALTPTSTPLFANVMGVEQGAGRIEAHVAALKTVSTDRDQFRLFWSLLPHILSDTDLRGKLDGLYDGYRRINTEALGVEVRTAADERRLCGVATLLTALCDGLGLLACLGDDREPRRASAGSSHEATIAAAYEVMGEMLEAYLPGLTSPPAAAGDDDPRAPRQEAVPRDER
jgi:AcrR family transcriptional regulator